MQNPSWGAIFFPSNASSAWEVGAHPPQWDPHHGNTGQVSPGHGAVSVIPLKTSFLPHFYVETLVAQEAFRRSLIGVNKLLISHDRSEQSALCTPRYKVLLLGSAFGTQQKKKKNHGGRRKYEVSRGWGEGAFVGFCPSNSKSGNLRVSVGPADMKLNINSTQMFNSTHIIVLQCFRL